MITALRRARRRFVLPSVALLLASAVTFACSSDKDNGGGGTGGTGPGGATASGGSTASGGEVGMGGGAAEGDFSHRYRVDQFGYLPAEEKIAVIGVPVTGHDAGSAFTGPGSTIEVRSTEDDSVVFSGSPKEWNGGQEDSNAGDRGYWFDFSEVTTPGEYYLVDVDLGHESGAFRIADDVYDDVMEQATRTFFYQREGFAKEEPYADARWTDGASHSNDEKARSVFDQDNADTERDVSGGWMDAGDQNKYVTFLNDVLPHLLYAYTHYPSAFTDATNIPESGNGVADIIDELDWELKFLLKMQDTDGGVFIKVGAIDWDDPSPPSSDTRPRFYGAKCTSSTVSFAAMVAQTAIVYKTIPQFADRADSLITAAELAWTNFDGAAEIQTTCDGGEVKSGDADMSEEHQLEVALRASYWLWLATGKEEYHTYFKENLTALEGVGNSWWGPYRIENSDVLLDYLSQAGADAATKTIIEGYVASMAGTGDFFGFSYTQALHRAYMPDWSFHWGSSRGRVHVGNLVMRMIDADVHGAAHEAYLKRARQHVHWMHGVNALSKVYLTNMGEYGAENDCSEIYHTWYADGTKWDSSITGTGPAPGFVPGGPTTSYVDDGGDASLMPPAGQPGEKAYLDFNDADSVSWAVTENSITYQAPYIRLLAAIIASKQTP